MTKRRILSSKGKIEFGIIILSWTLDITLIVGFVISLIKYGWNYHTFTFLFITIVSVAINLVNISFNHLLDKEGKSLLMQTEYQQESKKRITNSLSRIYFAVYSVDLENETYEEIVTKEIFREELFKNGNARDLFDVVCNVYTTEEYKDGMREFLNIDTMRARFGEKRIITHEFIGTTEGWVRANLIVEKRDDQGNVVRITYASQAIDEYKRTELENKRQMELQQKEITHQNDLMMALCAQYSSVYRIDLESDTFETKIIANTSAASDFLRKNGISSYSQALVTCVQKFVAVQDQRYIQNQMEIENIILRFKMEKEFFLSFHMAPNEQKEDYCEIHIVDMSAQDGEKVAIMGFRNIDDKIKEEEKERKEKEKQMDILRALGEGVVTAYYVDLDDDMYSAERVSDETRRTHSAKNKMPQKYSLAIQKYIDNYVEKDDVQTMAEALSIEGMKERFHKEKGYFVQFRSSYGKISGRQFFECHVVNVSKSTKENRAVVSFRCVDDEMKKELQVQKQLQDALEEAWKANHAKSDFLSRMSHDIRTPINGIMGLLDIEDRYAGDVEKQIECHNKIRTASEHLLSLINDVLDMNKLESGKLEFTHEPFSLVEVFKGCAEMILPQADDRHIRLNMSISDDVKPQKLIGSPLHVRQILLNILTNAVKYNKDEGTIDFRLDAMPDYGNSKWVKYRFTISDSGIGMSDEFMEHMFEAFTQANPSARTKYQGTGLGLAIVKKIVDQMNGIISVKSELGKGTTFIVTIPFEVCDETSPKEQNSAEKRHRLDGVRALLVEDNELNLEIAQFMLEDMGMTIESAENGSVAWNMFCEHEQGYYDLILMDIMMPVMDGLTATREIRKMDREDAKTIPIIAMTANAFAEDVKKCKEAGMNEHIAKPLDRKKVFETIRKSLV